VGSAAFPEHWDTGWIPSPAQCVKDLLGSDRWPLELHMPQGSQKKKKKKKEKTNINKIEQHHKPQGGYIRIQSGYSTLSQKPQEM